VSNGGGVGWTQGNSWMGIRDDEKKMSYLRKWILRPVYKNDKKKWSHFF